MVKISNFAYMLTAATCHAVHVGIYEWKDSWDDYSTSRLAEKHSRYSYSESYEDSEDSEDDEETSDSDNWTDYERNYENLRFWSRPDDEEQEQIDAELAILRQQV